MQTSMRRSYYGTLPAFILRPLMPAVEFLEVGYSMFGLDLVVGLFYCNSCGLAERADCLVRGARSGVAYPPWLG